MIWTISWFIRQSNFTWAGNSYKQSDNDCRHLTQNAPSQSPCRKDAIDFQNRQICDGKHIGSWEGFCCTCSTPAPAAFRAVTHLVPNIFPFTTPLEWATTNSTDFCRAIQWWRHQIKTPLRISWSGLENISISSIRLKMLDWAWLNDQRDQQAILI